DKRKESFVLQEGSLALALLSGRKAVPKLLQLYARSRSRFEWGAVAQALALVGDETAVEPLLRILKDKDRKPEERAIALAALGRMADENPTPVLSRFAQHLNLYAASPTLAELLQIL
ncbi:MAG: HEAT repeat domain-containing protein, partial [Planctomycetota bacterium]|nr:HEAT repeat domain-containing protein [Planctomycetota bacterium]